MHCLSLRHRHAAIQRHLMVGAMAALLVMIVCPAALADAIRLHDEMGVSSESVTLVQVAELTGERVERWGETVVGRFAGRDEIVITLDDVRRALNERAEVNWGLVTIRGHQRCRVIRLDPVPVPVSDVGADTQVARGGWSDAAVSGSAVASNIDQSIVAGDEATLRERIEAVISELAGVARDDLRIEFRRFDQRRLSETTWTERFEVEPRAASAIGRVPLTVRRYRGGQPMETFTLTADVQRRAEAVVVTRHLGRGDRFSADALERREVWLDDQRQPLAEPELVIGQQTASAIRPGSVVYPEDVRSPELVRRGELVTVRAVSGGLVVRTVGRAAEAGSLDETIRVRNEGSRETFHATVTGRREAVVVLDDAARPSPRADAERDPIEFSLAENEQAQHGDER